MNRESEDEAYTERKWRRQWPKQNMFCIYENMSEVLRMSWLQFFLTIFFPTLKVVNLYIKSYVP